MASPVVYYIRHGQTDWNAELRFQGQRDIPLNDKGRAQATANGETLSRHLGKAEDHTFISSPLGRTRNTMELVREAMGLEKSTYEMDDRLIEISYGDFEGTTQADLKERDRELYYYRKQNAWTFRPQNGESHVDTIPRIKDWYSSLEDGRKYIVTGHGAVGRVLRYILLDLQEMEAAKFAFPQNEVFRFENGVEKRFAATS